jgi:hypothetical protein
VKFNKAQKENLGKFFIDIAKVVAIGHVINAFFGKSSFGNIFIGIIGAAIFLITGLLAMKGLDK